MTEKLKPVGRNVVLATPPADTAEHVFLKRAVDLIGRGMFDDAWEKNHEATDRVHAEVIAALQSGRLHAFCLFGGMICVDTSEWADFNEAKRRIEAGSLRPFGGPSYGWSFIGRKSLSTVLRAVTKWRRVKTSAPFLFDMTEKRWRLFDAVIWVATMVHPTTTGEIASGSLDEKGARVLFAKLDDLSLLDSIKVTGLLPTIEMRSGISISWERAHTGWLGAAGHRIDFYEDPNSPGQIAADITMARRRDPSWVDVRIDRDDLLKLFPQEAGETAPAKAGGPRSKPERVAEDDCEDWLFSVMDASPGKRLRSRSDLEAEANRRWGLGVNAVGRARARAMVRGKGRFAAWASGGAH